MTRHSRGSCRVMEDDRHLDEPSHRPFGEDDRGGATVLVTTVCALGVFHVSVLVDDGHHVGDGLGIAFKHLPP